MSWLYHIMCKACLRQNTVVMDATQVKRKSVPCEHCGAAISL